VGGKFWEGGESGVATCGDVGRAAGGAGSCGEVTAGAARGGGLVSIADASGWVDQ
jgi:hypothetical protein